MNALEIFRGKPFGLGGVPFGNEFAHVTDGISYATIETAWNAGVRYYDTSPWYGLGLAERRLGAFLHRQTRSEYVLSSKVGKLLTASRDNNAKMYFPFTPSPNNLRYDYTADGAKRSIEDSLQRLGVDALDVAFVHDLSPDNPWLPGTWEEQFEIARRGAFPALSKMRDEGMIKGWGLGVNSPEPILKLMEVTDANVCLLARQYSLIDHGTALHRVFPKAREHGMALSLARRSTQVSSAGAPASTTARTTIRFPPRRSRNGFDCVRWLHATGSTFAPQRCSFRSRRTSRSRWLSAARIHSRSSPTTHRSRRALRMRFGPSFGLKG
jgi:D-threo-aldose 1-dehydrogenase